MTTLPTHVIHQAKLLEKLRSWQVLDGNVDFDCVGLPLPLAFAEVA
jgi:hypothetical protein